MKPKKENPLKTAVKELPKSTIDKLTLNKCFRYYYELDAKSKNDVSQYETRSRLKPFYENYIIEKGENNQIKPFQAIIKKWLDFPPKNEIVNFAKPLSQQEINKAIAFSINTICTYHLDKAEKLNLPLMPFLPTERERRKTANQTLKEKGIKRPKSIKAEAKKRGFDIDKIKIDMQKRIYDKAETIKKRMVIIGIEPPKLDFSRICINKAELKPTTKLFIELNRYLKLIPEKHRQLRKDIENLQKTIAQNLDF